MSMKKNILDRRVGYLHFPKTAGTSLATALVARTADRVALTSWRDAEDKDVNSPQLVHGHLIYDQLQDCMGEDAFLMTNFRHPIERSISLYRFRQRRPDDPDHEAAMSMTLDEFVAQGHGCQTYLPQLTNKVERRDDGTATVVPGEGTIAERLDLAEKRIDALDHVGISEYFDYSVLLLARDLKTEPFWSTVRVNTAPSPTTRDDFDPEVIASVTKNMVGEIRLYNYALERFKRDLATFVHGGIDI